ncbi:MAG: carboxypeptidase regulatory-like domain-containing protein [Acidobacteria bacterium]|nr:carboxypeptidase regulatory-like domain-containing protein [Acidobacteriota bacterium]
MALRALAFGILAVLIPTSALAQVGTITGRVRDAATREPVTIEVMICPESGACTPRLTNADGAYVFTGSAGTYRVFTRNTSSGTSYTNEIHGDILCNGACQEWLATQSGTPLALVPSATVVADFDLDRGGRIEGTVTSSGGAPLPGVRVQAISMVTGLPVEVGFADTSASGGYVIPGLPAGRYYAQTTNQVDYVNEVFDNISCPRVCDWHDAILGTPIDVTLGATVANRDFALDAAGRLTGIVTDGTSGLPIAFATVLAYAKVPGGLEWAGAALTNASGAYRFTGMAGGEYVAMAEAPPEVPFVSELFGGVQCPLRSCDFARGTPIPVLLGTETTGVNFALDLGGTIRGVVRNAQTGQSLGSTYVSIWRLEAGVPVEVGKAEPSTGEYQSTALPPGTYYAFSRDGYVRHEVYDDVPCAGEICTPEAAVTGGTPIVVTAGTHTTGVGFLLRSDVPPAAPDAPGWSVEDATVWVYWFGPSGGGVATSYVVEAGFSPGTTAVSLTSNERGFHVGGVPVGRYFVRVRGVNAYGTGPASEEIVVEVLPATGPRLPVPGNPQAWMSGSRLTLTWSAPYPAAAVTGYVLEAGSAPGLTDIATIGLNSRALTVCAVPPGNYFVRARALTPAGLGPPPIDTLVNAGGVASPPAMPGNLTSSVSGSTVTLSWLPPADGDATSHLVRAGSAPGLSNIAQVHTAGAATSAVFAGVPPGIYYVRVHAVNAVGAGVPTNDIAVVVQ